MCMLTAFNALFLVYVATFGLSLYAFILRMMPFDLETLPCHFSDRMPRGWITGTAPFAFLLGMLIFGAKELSLRQTAREVYFFVFGVSSHLWGLCCGM